MNKKKDLQSIFDILPSSFIVEGIFGDIEYHLEIAKTCQTGVHIGYFYDHIPYKKYFFRAKNDENLTDIANKLLDILIKDKVITNPNNKESNE